MGKKWWYIRGVQAQLVLLFLCFAQHAFAKPDSPTQAKKGKPTPAVRTHAAPAEKKTIATPSKKVVQPQVAKPQVARTSAKSKEKSPTRTLASTKQKSKKQISKTVDKRGTARSKSTVKKSTVTVISTKKGKKIVAVRTRSQAMKLAKSRSISRFASARAHRQQRRAVAALRRGSTTARAAALETRRILIERNYDAVDLSASYSPDTAPFLARLNKERLAYRVNSIFVLPGEDLTLNVGQGRKKNDYTLHSALPLTQLGPNAWAGKAPQEVGLYPVKISHANWGATIQLNVFVMVPLYQVEDGELNGYRIGHYPTTPLRQLATSTLPRGFIEVTEANENTRVSPHFRLRQFLCKQESGYPKYVVLDSRLLLVLETILKKVNERGHPTPTLSVMSGYRTPYYNRAIGNATTYSRHLWGDAADIFVDADPRDGQMDDLNDDGKIDVHDTEMLYDIVSELYDPGVQKFLAGSFFNEPILQQLITNGYSEDQRLQRVVTGGLARYRENGSHGPFVHVDVRGVFTQWGR
jgi:hypothetical protein